MKIKKLFVILLWYCRKITKCCRTRSFWRIIQKTHRFFEIYIKTCHNNQQIKIKSVKANLRIRSFRGKNEDEMKKLGEMSSIFEFCISKLGYMEVFMKIWEKMPLTIWLFNFEHLSEKDGKKFMPKMKMKMKKFGRMNLILEFSISKLGYMAIFMKIWEKIIDSFFKTFLTNWGKNKDVNEKMWENKFDLWILRIKIRLYGNFHENLRKKCLTHFLNHFY